MRCRVCLGSTTWGTLLVWAASRVVLAVDKGWGILGCVLGGGDLARIPFIVFTSAQRMRIDKSKSQQKQHPEKTAQVG